MRDIKLRYTFKRKEDGHIFQLLTSICALEEGSGQIRSMLANNLWELVGRDLCIGLNYENATEIYEGDIVHCFDDGRFCGAGVVKYGTFESSHEAGYSRGHFHIGFFIENESGQQCWDRCDEDVKWESVVKIGCIHNKPKT